ncbi:uncharacterized protein [Diadema setosum]|uniref:uncharacterized protein n=1 Tax=Diadema setosum TaxID=31175 RepID=UPI003B3AB294
MLGTVSTRHSTTMFDEIGRRESGREERGEEGRYSKERSRTGSESTMDFDVSTSISRSSSSSIGTADDLETSATIGNNSLSSSHLRSTDSQQSQGNIQTETVVEVSEMITATDSSGFKSTMYKVVIESTSISFHLPSSCVWRTYSDFAWLRRRLVSSSSLIKRKIPDLPSRNLLNLFDKDFAETRRAGLKEFLEKVVAERSFLSDAAVHLFLQSTLHVEEIQAWLDRKVDDPVSELVQRGKELVTNGNVTSL